MKNIICKAFFWGGGGIGDRDWTIMVLFHVVQGVNARDLLNEEFKAKKIVALEYKYNVDSVYYLTSTLSCFSKIRIPYP